MNRSILIVICDFLLVSLLAFSTVDINKVANPGAPSMRTSLTMNVNTNQASGASGGSDLGDVMKLALNEEQKKREGLVQELAATREAASKREADLIARQSQIEAYQKEIQLQQQKNEHLEQQETNLLQQVAAAQTNIQSLNQQIQATSAEVALSKEERAALAAAAKTQSEKAAALQQQLAEVQRASQAAVAEKERLSSQLQVAESEKNAESARLAQVQDEVRVRRDENMRLAEGVKSLAVTSSNLAREFHENMQLAANSIFEQLVTNRVLASFYAFKTGLLGDSSRYKQTQTALVSDGVNTFALCHVQDTPLTLFTPGTDWRDLSGTLACTSAVCPIASVWFYSKDPRIVLVPVSARQAQQLGCKVYQLSNDPFKFQEAVVVGTRENYYGEVKFQADLSVPDYLKMDHNSIKGLFGKFNPSSGDLVFSKSGDLIGVMANSVYCVWLRRLNSVATLQFGPSSTNQGTAETLSGLYAMLAGMPAKLQ